MSTTEATPRYTPADLLTMTDGDRYELVDGELVEIDMSGLSSLVANTVNRVVGNHVASSSAGYVFGSDCGYQCFPTDPSRVRRPDGSFIRRDRISIEELESGYIAVAPDLAIEVVSPHDLAYDLNAKVDEYLRAGVKLVWVIDPKTRTVTVHRPEGTDSRLHEDGDLTGEVVLPGFHCSIRDLFPEQNRSEAVKEITDGHFA